MQDPSAEAAIVVRQADLGHGGRPVLRRIDLRVAAGTHLVVTGDNGSGKSTLLATLAGLLRPHQGTVTVQGLDPVRHRTKLHARIGYLGHRDPLYPELTVAENLRLHARLRGLPDAAADAALTAVDMTEHADLRVSACSRGMARRAALAKAWLGDPTLLILDEPDSGLDTPSRTRLAALLAARGTTCIIATHHPATYTGWTHRRVDVHDGRLHETSAGGTA